MNGYYPGRATHAVTGIPVVPDPPESFSKIAEDALSASGRLIHEGELVESPKHPAHIMSVHEESGYRYVTVDRLLESVGDEPAVVYPDGSKFWYRGGKLHRDGDKPAVVYPNGVQEWWQNHQRHRDGKPAVIFPDSAAIVHEYRGIKQHWLNGKLDHEEFSPAVAAYRAQLTALRKLHFGEE